MCSSLHSFLPHEKESSDLPAMHGIFAVLNHVYITVSFRKIKLCLFCWMVTCDIRFPVNVYVPLYQCMFTLQECRAEHNIPQPPGQLAQLAKTLSSHTQIIVIFKRSQVPGQKHKHVCMRGEPRFIHSSSCLPHALGGSQAFPSAPRCMWPIINRGIKRLYLYLQSSVSILHCGQKCTQYPLSKKLSVSTKPQRALKSNDCFLECPLLVI